MYRDNLNYPVSNVSVRGAAPIMFDFFFSKVIAILVRHHKNSCIFLIIILKFHILIPDHSVQQNLIKVLRSGNLNKTNNRWCV